MRTIKISDEVWAEIAKRGEFGETEDDVLRRIFGVPTTTRQTTKPGRYAKDRLSVRINDNKLHVRFSSGVEQRFDLPSRIDREGIKTVTHNAMRFAEENGATIGQVNAVRKKLTDSGYLINKDLMWDD